MNNFKKWIIEYNKFTKGDRHAIIILAVLIVLTLIVTFLLPVIIPDSEFDYSNYQEEIEQLENQSGHKLHGNILFQFNPNTISQAEIDSLNIPENIKRNLIRYRNAGGGFRTEKDLRKIYGMTDSIFSIIVKYAIFSVESDSDDTDVVAHNSPVKSDFDFFNPNKAEQSELVDFGFSQFQAKNVIAYRSRGGVFKVPDDLLKIYGVDSALFNSVKSHIRIEIKDFFEQEAAEEVLLIELNGADSASLLDLSGIGPSFAGRIIRYRERLGGFHSATQILEIYNFPAETFSKIEGQIYVDSMKIRKIRVNFSDFKDLIKHPYFTKQQVNLLLKYRDVHGPFQNINQVKASGVFDEITFKKIEPYLTCR